MEFLGAGAADVGGIDRSGAGNAGAISRGNAVAVIKDAAQEQDQEGEEGYNQDNGGGQAELFRAGHGWLPNFGDVTVYNIQLFFQTTISEHTVLLIEL